MSQSQAKAVYALLRIYIATTNVTTARTEILSLLLPSGSVSLKRSAACVPSDDDEAGVCCPPSPRDVSSVGRRSSPDLLSPRAGKIARSQHSCNSNVANNSSAPGATVAAGKCLKKSLSRQSASNKIAAAMIVCVIYLRLLP